MRCLMVKKRANFTKSQKSTKSNSWGWHPAPLKGSFMILAIIGFLTSLYLVYPKNTTWGITFLIVFAAMFFASIISMTKAPVVE